MRWWLKEVKTNGNAANMYSVFATLMAVLPPFNCHDSPTFDGHTRVEYSGVLQ